MASKQMNINPTKVIFTGAMIALIMAILSAAPATSQTTTTMKTTTVLPTNCYCGDLTNEDSASCKYNFTGSKVYSNCTCLFSNNMTSTYMIAGSTIYIYCEVVTPTTEKVITNFGVCDTAVVRGSKRTVLKVMLYIGSIWVIIWTVLCFIINIVLKERGHHRYIGLVEEIAIIIMFIFLGFLTTYPDHTTFCKATTVILQIFMTMILAFFVFEAVFAHSLIKGNSKHNGSIPPVLNYIIPVILSLIVGLVSYFTLKDDYADTGVHCFVSTTSDMLWAFGIPDWILTVITLLIGQLAFLACIQASPEVDERQLFWAKKSCKALPILILMLLAPYYLAMFALDQQKFWLTIMFFLVCLPLGPTIFVCHTYCYLNTSTWLYNKTSVAFYTPCPIKDDRPPTPEEPPEEEKPPEPEEEPKEEPKTEEEPPKDDEKPKDPEKKPDEKPKEETPEAPKPEEGPPKTPPAHDPTASQDFYNWVVNRNPTDVDKSQNILFRPRPV
uniref:G_PROTEIN_RECEP_F2_4 domain-containing protein n=1 Tax=Panagrellus redivivus TaxID=6233 RepID=A0A7E4VL71_PANRE